MPQPYELQLREVGSYLRLKVIADNWSAPVAVACPNVIGKFLTRD